MSMLESEKKIMNFKIELDKNEETIQKMKDENKKLEIQNLNLKNEIKSSQSKFDILLAKFENFEIKVDKLEKENQILRNQCHNFEIQIKNLQTQITLLISEKQSSIEKINKLKEEKNELANKNQELEGTFNFFKEVIEDK